MSANDQSQVERFMVESVRMGVDIYSSKVSSYILMGKGKLASHQEAHSESREEVQSLSPFSHIQYMISPKPIYLY
jgi:hypothetical protein